MSDLVETKGNAQEIEEKEKENGYGLKALVKSNDRDETGYELKGLPNVLANYESMVPNRTDRILMAELAHSKRYETLGKYFDHLKLNKETHFKAESVVNHVALHTYSFPSGGTIGNDAALFPPTIEFPVTGTIYTANVSLLNKSGYSLSKKSNGCSLAIKKTSIPSPISNNATGNWASQSQNGGDATNGNAGFTFTIGSGTSEVTYTASVNWKVKGDGTVGNYGGSVSPSGSGQGIICTNTPAVVSNSCSFSFSLGTVYGINVSFTNDSGYTLTKAMGSNDVPSSIKDGKTKSWSTTSSSIGGATYGNASFTFTIGSTTYTATVTCVSSSNPTHTETITPSGSCKTISCTQTNPSTNVYAFAFSIQSDN